MSSIDKLLIRGIRSFDPQSQNIIEFYAPLTVIVGPNGTGKTTIIECLKFATTGDLPPNSKGGAFVFDPKLANETEIKAQVRLKFNNINKQTMVVTRSLQLTQKKTKAEMKTLESLLVTKDPTTGEQVSISSRCAELDVEIPNQLGVSKAILENVIFCHQEEANWPLAEPSILKKKFDDIFAATKYTRALDELKSIKKDRGAELKLDQQRLEFLKLDVEKAKRIRINLESTEEKIQSSRSKIALFDGDLKDVVETLTHLMDKLQQEQTILNEIDKKSHEIRNLQGTIEELHKNATILMESETELLEKLDGFRRDLLEAEKNVSELEGRRSGFAKEIADLQREVGVKMAEKGLVAAQMQTLTTKLNQRRDRVIEVSKSLFLPLNSEDLDGQKIDAAVVQISQRSDELTRQIQELRNEQRREEQTLSEQSQKWFSLKNTSSEMEKVKRQSIEALQGKLVKLQGKLTQSQADCAEVESLQAQAEHERDQLESCKDTFHVSQFDTKLSTKDTEKKSLEHELGKARQAMDKLGALSELNAKLSLKRAERKKKEFALAGQSAGLVDEATRSFGIVVLQEDVHSSLERLKDEKLRNKHSIEQHMRESLSTAASSGNMISMLSDELKRAEIELSGKTHRVQTVTNRIDDFAVHLENVSKQLHDIRSKIAAKSQSSLVFKDFIETSRENENCPLCRRSFEARAVHVKFLKELESQIADFPSYLKECRSEEARLQKVLDDLTHVRPFLQHINELKVVHIPGLRERLKGVSHENETVREKLAALEQDKCKLDLDLGHLESLLDQSKNCQIIKKELKSLDSEISFIESDLALSMGLASVGSMAAVRLEIQDLESQVRTLQCELDDLGRERTAKLREIQMRELRHRDVLEKLHEALRIQEEGKKIEKERDSLKAELQQLDLGLASQTAEIAKIQPELTKIQQRRDFILKEYADKETSLAAELRSVEKSLSEIRAISEDIAKLRQIFTTSSPNETLQFLDDAVASLNGQIARAQTGIQEIDHESGRRTSRLSEMQILERNIRDNLHLRELSAILQSLEREYGTLTLKMGTMNEAGHQSYGEQLGVLKEKQSKLMTQRASLFGELKQLEDQAFRLSRELTTDYKNAEAEFEQTAVQVKTTELLLLDLDKYGKALDQAIMRYHSLKMEEINKIIRELWVSTYQGTDIDTIEIRSDAESTRGNRSYDYRVVMIKSGDTELDMRGRSSAGQRVLTSIIIRLALAETFGLSCGILALDEPTTNLDRANIESLAESLVNIIKSRQSQSNFQLIIITHDEDFVSLLGRSEYVDHYWRVGRDDKQRSFIEKQSILG